MHTMIKIYNGLIIIHWPTRWGEFILIDFCGCFYMFGTLEDVAFYAIVFKGTSSLSTFSSSAPLKIFDRIYKHSPEIAKKIFFGVAFDENIPLLCELSEIYPQFLPTYCSVGLTTLIYHNKNKSFLIMTQNVRDFYDIYKFYGSSPKWKDGLFELSKIILTFYRERSETKYVEDFVGRFIDNKIL